tara:strand:- start:4869 stop:6101 length:1233 start_codon:yes stop_codon:yes gene_type:complete
LTTTAHAPDSVDGLLTPEAVRERCSEILLAGLDGDLPWFNIDMSKLSDAASRVVTEIENNYPSGNVPFHSRWRHFEQGDTDLWADMAAARGLTGSDLAVAAGDLAIVSVLLDAGAGPDWIYTDDATGLRLGRSEGLALASLRLFESGLLSADKNDPLRADASALSSLTAETLGRIFQVTDHNPLVGLEQRAGLLRKLGDAIRKHPSLYARDGAVRPGNLIAALAQRPGLEARDILVTVLSSLMDIWPSPVRIDGRPLGDVGDHSALIRSDATNGIVPFHKLSQWLSYSLIEPLEQFGITVSDLDGLTGLAEYRNGGLLIDAGLLTLRDKTSLSLAHTPSSELIVEWRALTVALLDRLANDVRTSLNKSAKDLPLASILQGGTWSAGRKIAAELRADGGPPISLYSDATVF